MHVNHFKGPEEHKQWCDYRRIFLASRFARALAYRAGPANPPVLQAIMSRHKQQKWYHLVEQAQGYLINVNLDRTKP